MYSVHYLNQDSQDSRIYRIRTLLDWKLFLIIKLPKYFLKLHKTLRDFHEKNRELSQLWKNPKTLRKIRESGKPGMTQPKLSKL